jgi:hypothetical protein
MDNSQSESSEHNTTSFPIGAIVLAATKWSVVSSLGFLLPSIFFSLLFIFLEFSSKKKKQRERDVGGFAVFMILLELVDAVPEAAMIAQSTVNRNISWSFVLSILSLNIVNTSASAIDFLATKNSNMLHKILFALLFFSVGMLSFSISVDVYGKFVEEFKHDQNVGHIALLVFGTMTGYLLIILLMNLEMRLHQAKEHAGGESDETLFELLRVIQQQLSVIIPKLDHYYHWKTMDDSAPLDISAFITSSPPPSRRSPSTLDNTTVSRHKPIELPDFSRKPVVEISDEEAPKLLHQANDLRQMETLIKFMYTWSHGSTSSKGEKQKLAIVEDFSVFLTEKTLDKLDKEASKKQRVERRKQVIAKFLGTPLQTRAENTEATPLVPTNSIYARSVKFIFFMAVVFTWSVGLTSLLALCLIHLEARTTTVAEYMAPFCEGLSGGAFLSTIAGTMIFRIQQDFYGSEWSVYRSKTIGMTCFVTGVVVSSLIAMTESE